MKDEILYFLIEKIVSRLVVLLGRTLRLSVYGLDRFKNLKNQGGFIYVTFHGRMFIPVWFHRNSDITALVSQSRDGELVTKLVKGLGLGTVRGSSTRGTRAGLRDMLRILKEGRILANMVDGPRGPREDPKIGALALARLSGLPVLPVVGACYPSWEFHSWDRFQLPKPFSRAVLLIGEPFHVPSDARGEALEKLRIQLKENMIALRKRADRLARGKDQESGESG